MLTPRQPAVDCQGPVHARLSKRRERKPGTRERHSAQHERHSLESHSDASSTPRSTFVGHVHTGGYTERCTFRPNYNQPHRQINPKNEEVNEVQVVSQYKELTTIENIRKQMAAQARPKETHPTLPEWLLNLDLNLDVTAVDTIPPYEREKSNVHETYSNRPKVTIIHEDNYTKGANDEISTENKVNELDSLSDGEAEEYPDTDDRRATSRLSTYSKQDEVKTGPRRYQGDMRVMSLQKGGIRSTPFQPKSKKFINQMITFQHMKVHNKKLRSVKPAVDSKMPSTFHIALDRKKLVEERLNDSWNASYQSSTPRRSATPSSLKSSSKEKTQSVSL